jgi:predicted enzyme related to lactoylglutathione lyase
MLGLRTVVYYTPDLAKARQWYAQAFDTQPYFDTPYYVGFNIGGYELGLHPDEGTKAGAGGAVAYWGVTDIAAEVARLVSLGAPVHSAVQDVGEGIKVATVLDPFGNHVGLIENPHFALPPAGAA